ncbi:MAG: hypothetical protein IEMM0002_0117 [bacterium]|nr:MAG: hypothetical protein IEMM0002_0117 [bacterium]
MNPAKIFATLVIKGATIATALSLVEKRDRIFTPNTNGTTTIKPTKSLIKVFICLHRTGRPQQLKGAIAKELARDRTGSFNPQFVRKGQTRLTHFDGQILALYARGMSTRDIVATFQEMYGADVSPTLVSKVTESVLDRVLEWQSRPLDDSYPIVYLDCIVLKVRQDKRVINKSVYIALGINMEGQKELLGLWLSENEGAKFWLSILTELQNRGVKDIFIACVDGLSGFPEAINTAFSFHY